MLLNALEQAIAAGRRAVVCDVSPPRPSTAIDLAAIRGLRADVLCCAYLPGRAVRLNASTMAAILQRELGVEAAYAVATRDMNRLALSAQILSAVVTGVENVVVLHGDDFGARDRGRVHAVHDTTPTQMIATAAELTQGRDFRGRALGERLPLCIGAALNPERDLAAEVDLTIRKVEAGAQFFLSEPICDPTFPERFDEAYARAAGRHLGGPVGWGVAVLAPNSRSLSALPQHWRDALAAGCSGVELALEFSEQLAERGIRQIYLIPPIFAGGNRDYAAAADVIEQLRRG